MATVEELKALLEKATPGPWKPCPVTDDLGVPSVQMIQSYTNEPLKNAQLYATHDAALIVAAVNALPALLDVAEAALRCGFGEIHPHHHPSDDECRNSLCLLRRALARLGSK